MEAKKNITIAKFILMGFAFIALGLSLIFFAEGMTYFVVGLTSTILFGIFLIAGIIGMIIHPERIKDVQKTWEIMNRQHLSKNKTFGEKMKYRIHHSPKYFLNSLFFLLGVIIFAFLTSIFGKIFLIGLSIMGSLVTIYFGLFNESSKNILKKEASSWWMLLIVTGFGIFLLFYLRRYLDLFNFIAIFSETGKNILVYFLLLVAILMFGVSDSAMKSFTETSISLINVQAKGKISDKEFQKSALWASRIGLSYGQLIYLFFLWLILVVDLFMFSRFADFLGIFFGR